MKQTLLVCLSATLFAQAFILPTYMCWALFVFLIPLYWLVTFAEFRLIDAILWSALFVLQAYWALFIVILQHGQTLFKYVALLFFYSYLTIYSSLWLIGYIFILRFIKDIRFRLVLFFGVTQLFFIMSPYIFCIFGLGTRNYFFNPLVCLSIYPQLVKKTVIFPEWMLLLTIILINLFLFLSVKKNWRFILVGLTPLLFMMGFSKEKKRNEKNIIGCVLVPPFNNESAYERAQQLVTILLDYTEQHSEKKILLLPESAYPFALNTPELYFFLEMLDYTLDETWLLIGAHKKNNEALYNCFYYIYNGRIIHHYDKKALVPFFECPSLIWNNFYCNALFLNNKKEFTTLKRVGEGSFIIDNMKLHPYLCSEFFFENHRPPNETIVVLANDSWFSCAYFKNLLNQLVIYRALRNNLTICYCSYSAGGIINKYGANWEFFLT